MLRKYLVADSFQELESTVCVQEVTLCVALALVEQAMNTGHTRSLPTGLKKAMIRGLGGRHGGTVWSGAGRLVPEKDVDDSQYDDESDE